jgi:hypothetical protein
VPNQLTGIDPETVVAENERDQVRGRAVVVKRLKPLPIEAVVRGYVIGSGWKDYQETGAICGIALPPGLKMAAKLPSPIFTPATKAEVGDHDENVSFATAQANCAAASPKRSGTGKNGAGLADEARIAAIRLYEEAAAFAWPRHHHRRHQVRVRHRRRRHPAPDRRSPDPGLLALLAGRPVPGRQQPAVLRQAVRPRLPGNAGLGQGRPRPQVAGRRHRPDQRKVHRSLRKADRQHAVSGCRFNKNARITRAFSLRRLERRGWRKYAGDSCFWKEWIRP